MQQGCDGFEFDLRRSADDRAVICHDAIAGGMTIASSASRSLRLPALEDVLRQFADRAFLDIELKVAGLEAPALVALHSHPPQKGYVVSSFLPDVLRTIYDLDQAIPLGFLCESAHQLRDWRQMKTGWVIPQFGLVDSTLVEQVHDTEKRIMVWTVNHVERMCEFVEWGVDAIISDETELLVRSLRQG